MTTLRGQSKIVLSYLDGGPPYNQIAEHTLRYYHEKKEYEFVIDVFLSLALSNGYNGGIE